MVFVLISPVRTCGLDPVVSPLPLFCLPSQAALKKYQVEHKTKGESLEKCQAELKKLRRKSQGSKNPSKYGEKEMQVSVGGGMAPAAKTQRQRRLPIQRLLLETQCETEV